MASPFQVGSLVGSVGLEFGAQSKCQLLCDGSVLVMRNTANATATLSQITAPATGTPTVADLAQTFTSTSATIPAFDLYVTNNGNSTSDIHMALINDAGSNNAINVAHGTYTASSGTFSWDNTSFAAVASNASYSPLGSIAWTGSWVIVLFRAGSSNQVNFTWTATKAGNAGWSASALFGSSSNTGSHNFPVVRHCANLGGNGKGGTVALYTADGASGHSDVWKYRILDDTKTDPSLANWTAEANVNSTTAYNVGAGQYTACVDSSSGRVHLVWCSSATNTGVFYATGTPNSALTSITWASPVTVATGTANTTPAVCVDAGGNAYVFWSSGAIGSTGTVSYSQIVSPYTSAGSSTATVANTTGDGYPKVPNNDTPNVGYIPLLYSHGTATFTAQYDNTIAAESADGSSHVHYSFGGN